MKKVNEDEPRQEYTRDELGTGVRGKYLGAFRAGTNIVRLDPDVANVFPTDESVNEALRSLIDTSVSPTKTS
jgi:hypothetical protein